MFEPTNGPKTLQAVLFWLQENVPVFSGLSKGNHRFVCPSSKEPVEVHIQLDNAIDILKAKEIGETGMGVVFSYSMGDSSLIGLEVDLVIKLPGARSFVVKGKISGHKHLQGEGDYYAIDFIHLSKKGHELLSGYVLNRLKEECNDSGDNKRKMPLS